MKEKESGRKRKFALLLMAAGLLCCVTACESSQVVSESKDGTRVESGEESGSDEQSDASGEDVLSKIHGIRKEYEAESLQGSMEKTGIGDHEQSEDSPGKLSDRLADFQISIDGVVYQFPMEYSKFEALGWEYESDREEILDAQSWDMPAGLWYREGYGVYIVLANPTTKPLSYSECFVSGIILMDAFLTDCDWEIVLPGGIRYGVSGVDEIREAYGDPDYGYEQAGMYTLRYGYQTGDREVILGVYGDDQTLRYIDMKNVIGIEPPQIDQELQILQ